MSATDDRAKAVLAAMEKASLRWYGERGAWLDVRQILDADPLVIATSEWSGRTYKDHLPETAVRVRLKQMLEAGIVEKQGNPPKTEWRVKP